MPHKEQHPLHLQDLHWDLRDKLFQPLFLFQSQIPLRKRGRGYSRVWRRLWRPWPVLNNSLFVHVHTRGEQKRAEQLSDFSPFKSSIFSLQILFFSKVTRSRSELLATSQHGGPEAPGLLHHPVPTRPAAERGSVCRRSGEFGRLVMVCAAPLVPLSAQRWGRFGHLVSSASDLGCSYHQTSRQV